jgi:urease accessory protein
VPETSAMSWAGRLELRYRSDDRRTVCHDRHHGPLRVLQALYPEGPRVCHHVLVHPPGGIVGGDTLDIDVEVGDGAHALITTPGAARFYRSAGATAVQSATLQLGDGARLEWLPLEAIAYDGCIAENKVRFELAPTAEMIGWDLAALGLPAAQQPFARGSYLQQLEWPGVWLERGRIDAGDERLMQSSLGLAGRKALGTLWFASGAPIDGARRDALLDAARAVDDEDTLAGATSPDERLVVLRVLAHRVEPAMQRLAAAWAAWRRMAWQLDAPPPRVWRT